MNECRSLRKVLACRSPVMIRASRRIGTTPLDWSSYLRPAATQLPPRVPVRRTSSAQRRTVAPYAAKLASPHDSARRVGGERGGCQARTRSAGSPSPSSARRTAPDRTRGDRRAPRPRRCSGPGCPARAAIARTIPPLAVPSSFVRTMPVTPSGLRNARACASAVLAGGRVEHEQRLVRRAAAILRRHAADLLRARPSGRSWCAGGRRYRR